MGRAKYLTLFGQIGSYPVWSFNLDGTAVAVGLRFSVSVECWLVGAAWLQNVGNTSWHVIQLGDTTTGDVLRAMPKFPQAVAGGEGSWAWVRGFIRPAWKLTPGTVHELSVWNAFGDYATAPGYFASAISAPPFTVPANVSGGAGNGVFVYGVPFQSLANSANGTAYAIDPMIQPDVNF